MQLDILNARSVKGACLALFAAALTTGCATTKSPYDYTHFKQSRPAPILVPPPLNTAPVTR